MKPLSQKLIEARAIEKQLRSNFAMKEVVGQTLVVDFNTRAISIDEKNKTATFVMSTVNIDRHGDIIDQNSWILDHFLKNPAFFLQHRSDHFPIGKWINVWLEADPDNIGKQRLVGTAEFRTEYEDGARAFNHVVKGDMNMVSVGFIPHRVDYDEEKDAFVLYDCELLECSLVGIGSNRQALAKNKEPAEIKSDLINARNALNETIDKALKKRNNDIVISHLKARENLNKAIRNFVL